MVKSHTEQNLGHDTTSCAVDEEPSTEGTGVDESELDAEEVASTSREAKTSSSSSDDDEEQKSGVESLSAVSGVGTDNLNYSAMKNDIVRKCAPDTNDEGGGKSCYPNRGDSAGADNVAGAAEEMAELSKQEDGKLSRPLSSSVVQEDLARWRNEINPLPADNTNDPQAIQWRRVTRRASASVPGAFAVVTPRDLTESTSRTPTTATTNAPTAATAMGMDSGLVALPATLSPTRRVPEPPNNNSVAMDNPNPLVEAAKVEHDRTAWRWTFAILLTILLCAAVVFLALGLAGVFSEDFSLSSPSQSPQDLSI